MPLLVEGLPLWLAATNSWIVSAQGAGGECVLIDAPPDPTAIVERLTHHRLRLVALLSTHGHVDHIGGVGEVVRSPSVGPAGASTPVHIHDGDRHMLLDPVGTSGQFGRYLEAAGLDVRPPEVICGIDDGERISGAGLTFTAIHTPGHTQGSVCFLLEAGDGDAPPLLFSGDHLFRGSVGRTDLPGGSWDELMASMAEKILPMDDGIAVLPGHGEATTIGHERHTNPFLLELLRQRR